MSEPFTTRTGQVEQFAADFAKRLLAITGGCRPDMHEPDEAGLRQVNLVGDHLDNAMGEFIDAKQIEGGFQEYVLILDREPDDSADRLRQREAFNLATLIAFARIGAKVIQNNAKAEG